MSETVNIGGREFRVGATYRGRGINVRERKLLRIIRGGNGRVWVEFETRLRRPGRVLARSWLEWAGDEVQP